MKTFVKNTLTAMILSTCMVLADDKTTSMLLDINKDLPQMIAAGFPESLPANETDRASYSPLQKASIADLKLTVQPKLHELPLELASRSLTYSPLQKARIVGLKLTAEVAQNELLRTTEKASTTYSPQQKAKIAGLVLTGE
jgi:hypothetical protein